MGDEMIPKTVKHEKEVVQALNEMAQEEGVEVSKLIRRATKRLVQDWRESKAA